MKRNGCLLRSPNTLPLPVIISYHIAPFIFLIAFTTISNYHAYCLPPLTKPTPASVSEPGSELWLTSPSHRAPDKYSSESINPAMSWNHCGFWQ